MRKTAIALTGFLALGGMSSIVTAATPGQRCQRAVGLVLASCVNQVGSASLRCFKETGSACPTGDARTTRALDAVNRAILRRCADEASVAAAGYAPLTPAELVTRFQMTCQRASTSSAARSFGDPGGSLLAGADAASRRCLLATAREARMLVAKSLRKLGHCARGTCDVGKVEQQLQSVAARATAKIGNKCADLFALVGIGTAAFVAEAQARIASVASSPCDPLDTAHCLFPFPNDYFSFGDPTTSTQRRVSFAPVGMPINITGVRVDPTSWNELDGFSVGALGLMQFPTLDLDVTGAPLQTNIAHSLDPDSPIVLIDAETGEQQLIWVERDMGGSVPSERPLMIRVGRNLPDGHRFILAARQLRDGNGTLLSPNPVFQAYRDRTATTQFPVEARRAHMEEIFATLASAGLNRSELLAAWDFTTQSTDSVAGRMLHIRDDAFTNVLGSAAPAFQVESIDEPLDSRIFRRIDGTFQSPLYLTAGGAPGALLRIGPDGLPVNQGDYFTARFRCLIPWSATTAGAAPAVPGRPALYGHGLLGSETETSSGHVRDMASEHDFIICGTRWTGFEEDDLLTVFGVLQDFSKFPAFIDRQHQGILNFMVLGRLLLHPDGFASDPAFQVGGESVIDPAALFYDGNSQGGILGGALAAFEQDITRFSLGVPGINYSTLLARSVDFQPFNDILEVTYPDGFDRAVLISVAQMIWDRTDPSGHINHVTADPYPNTPPKKLLYQVAFGDHQVANVTVEVAARSNGALIHQPAVAPGKVVPDVDPYYGIPAIPSYPFDGSAVVIWDSGNPAAPVGNVPPATIDPSDPEFALLSPCAQAHDSDPHECPRRQPEARLQKSEFLRVGGAVVDVCGGGPCFAPAP